MQKSDNKCYDKFMIFKTFLISCLTISLLWFGDIIHATELGVRYIGEMNTPRAMHHSQKIADGTVLIYGGYNKKTTYTTGEKGAPYHYEKISEKSFEIYNPINNTFKIINKKIEPSIPEEKSITKKEQRNIVQYFKSKKIYFQKISYQKADKERIVCIPYKNAIPIGYGQHDSSEYFAIYNLKTKKISNPVSFNNLKAEYVNMKSFKTTKGTKILFVYVYDAEKDYSRIGAKTNIKFQTLVFNIDKNITEKISEPISKKYFYEHKLFQLENGNIIIEEGNVFKYIFDVKNEKMLPLKNYGFKMLANANVLPLNNHQLLITGGYTTKDNIFLKKTKYFNGKKHIMLEEQIGSKAAYIYTF